MFRDLRRTDRRMEHSSVEAILQDGDYGVMSCIGDDGYGYGVALNYVYCDNAIYYHCAYEGHKLDAIKNNNKVSFLVVNKSLVIPDELRTRYESVIVFGKASLVEGQEKDAVLYRIGEKYSKGFEDVVKDEIEKISTNTCVMKIQIEHKEGKCTE
ncbi:MAG: Pyridoxamine 5'-phosphate oxidase-related FMN-binding protein [Clostridiales bacterium 38_11]|nr:MAG: Pyridoxamine 5'-phosphate oxidase-related FMN-binding protein [Clostridiales bacterium 38_11]HBH13617.1 MFS transporter [Clostridiales bacterium]